MRGFTVNIFGNLLLILACLFRSLEENFFRKSLAVSKRSDRFQPGKVPEIIEHVSYSIKYWKI